MLKLALTVTARSLPGFPCWGFFFFKFYFLTAVSLDDNRESWPTDAAVHRLVGPPDCLLVYRNLTPLQFAFISHKTGKGGGEKEKEKKSSGATSCEWDGHRKSRPECHLEKLHNAEPLQS